MAGILRPFLTVACCLLLSAAAAAQTPEQKPEVLKVTDRVYCATGFALGNVIFLITDRSLVVVDTTESLEAARETLAAFRKVSPAGSLPVSHIIYTHHHGDHIRGASAFKGATTKIVAQRSFVTELAKYNLLGPYYRRVAEVQFGAPLSVADRAIRLAIRLDSQGAVPPSGYLPPDVLFDEEYVFEEGGVRFELYHTRGETLDHLMVWLPQEHVLLPGDLFYDSFPMLSSPMKPQRPVLEWAESLQRMRKLQPDHLVPSHWQPLAGRDAIDAILANYARAIRFVHDETVQRINQGLPLEEIRKQVRLPEELAKLPYLAERYGRVEWAVNGIYSLHTGWYDFNPAHLNPGRSAAFNRAVFEASGGADALVKRAGQALRDQQPQLALELANVILSVADQREAHVLSAEALEQLAAASTNTVQLNIYRAAAAAHKKAAEK